jgi:hypothetical protein
MTPDSKHPLHHQVDDMSTASKPKIAILGYGSQGRAHALNLRDSGFDVTVGLRAGGPTEIKAKADGFTPKTPAEAVRGAELVAVLTPDMVQPQLYGETIEPNIAPGACLLFAHGFNVHYGQIAPREDLDVVLVAPKGPGALVRADAPRNSRWPIAPASAARARTRSRPHSRRKPRPTCSANRPCSAAAPRNSCRPAGKRWSKPATSPKSPTTSACTN